MAHIGDTLTIRGNIIRNRIVMPPMVCFSFKGGRDGMFGPEHAAHYARRAQGGAGLIIVQATPVSGADSRSGAWSKTQQDILREIGLQCHQAGAAAMIQLCGHEISLDRKLCGNMEIETFSKEHIRSIQQDCIEAAHLAAELGFDGAEYHFAHGYTFCRFLDPSANLRTDEYGGTVENRTRLLSEILPRIRQRTHERFILSVRMGGNIPDPAGAAEVAKAFEKAGIDLIHASSGMHPPENTVPENFPGNATLYNGTVVKQRVDIPVIAVNGITTAGQAANLIDNGLADLAAVGRGMLADASWTNGALKGDSITQCLGCRECRWFDDHTKCPAQRSRM